MTFVELPVVPIYWHFPRTIKGYYNRSIYYILLYNIYNNIHYKNICSCYNLILYIYSYILYIYILLYPTISYYI